MFSLAESSVCLQGKSSSVLALRTHHSIMDGSSLQVLTADLEAAYSSLAKHNGQSGRWVTAL